MNGMRASPAAVVSRVQRVGKLALVRLSLARPGGAGVVSLAAAAARRIAPALETRRGSRRGGARDSRRIVPRSAADGTKQAPAEGGTSTAVADGPLRVELDTAEARRSIRFDAAPMGFGQAIVVVEVTDRSEAQEACVRPGMRLTAISDPIRPFEVWKLQDRPSLKNIRELLRMRSAETITLEFERWDGPMPGLAGDSLSAVSSGSGTDASSAASPLVSSDGPPGESIGDRMARQYREAAAAGRTPTAVEQRMQRRKARMEEDARRDDRPFLLGLLALFALPPLIILAIAQGSGYLDQLYLNTLTGLK